MFLAEFFLFFRVFFHTVRNLTPIRINILPSNLVFTQMRTEKIGNIVVEFYEGQHELPIKNHVRSQKYIMTEKYVGSSMESIDEHFAKFDLFISHGKIDELKEERINLHANFFHVIEELDHNSLAFGCFIKSIDGNPIDYSESSLKNILNRLSDQGLTFGMVSDILGDLKKNSMMK